MSQDRLLQRFLRYVIVDTTAGKPGAEYPSSPGQLLLGKQITEEIRNFGLSNAEQDEFGLVYATLPANVEGAPVVAFNSHLDTSPETTGKGVNPQVIKNYEGGDVVLSADSAKVITEKENPELKELHGCTLITTDGTTLLGADDKAGIAVILEAVERLIENPDIPHGEVKILLTCDEEIGHGVDHVDLKKLGADVCYTLDGDAADFIHVETFSADGAKVTIKGINIHPSIAKERMVNAVKIAARFLEQLPPDRLSPETTSDREGFVHPYTIQGGVEQVELSFILRSFDTPELSEYTDFLNQIAKSVMQEFPGSEILVESYPQYRNLGDGLKKDPRVVDYAIEAHKRLQREPTLEIIRGGTDGSMLTAKGLPTPNLSTGQHNPHSPLEWACLEEMEKAVELLIALLGVWAEKK